MSVTRTIALALTGLFLVLLPLQFLFAGYGVFSGKYDTHELFGGLVLHGITLLMAIFFAVGRQWKFSGLAFVLVLAIFVQIGFAAMARENDQPWLGALHPFMAFCYWPYVYLLIWRPALAHSRVAGPATTTTHRHPKRVHAHTRIHRRRRAR